MKNILFVCAMFFSFSVSANVAFEVKGQLVKGSNPANEGLNVVYDQATGRELLVTHAMVETSDCLMGEYQLVANMPYYKDYSILGFTCQKNIHQRIFELEMCTQNISYWKHELLGEERTAFNGCYAIAYSELHFVLAGF